jgi:hypothetical protein
MLYYAAPNCFRSYLSNQSEKLLQSNHPIQKHPLPFHDRAAVSRFHLLQSLIEALLVPSEQGRNGLHPVAVVAAAVAVAYCTAAGLQ